MTNIQSGKKVLVFGTFDGIHPGHIHFLSEAKKLGNLYVSVSSDESALQRKGRNPKNNLQERMRAMKDLEIAIDVLPGDKTLNEWTALKIVKPDIIALGFDQYGLKTVLMDIKNKFGFEVQVMTEYNEQEIF